MAQDTDAPLAVFLAAGERMPQRPWPRYRLSVQHWRELVGRLAQGARWSLLGLWGDHDAVHAALFDEMEGSVAVASLDCPDGRFPSLSAVCPGAIRLERAARDLFGLVAEALADTRPWLDHGQWRNAGAERQDQPAPTAYRFLPAEGEGLHQVPVGPIHAGTIEPGVFRFHCNGEVVVRLEQRFGYTHKGTEALMAGKPLAAAARLAARLSGDSTVACSLAFAHAVEAATGTSVPERAIFLRALLAELERIANHLGDIGAICNDAAFAFMLSHCGVLREQVLITAGECFGHRLMMDAVQPGGTACDLAAAGVAKLDALVHNTRRRLDELMAVYDDKPSLLDRTVGTGVVTPALARLFAAGGHVGRASGRDFDARRSPGYPPYDRLAFDVPVLTDGDVHSRLLIRVQEIEVSHAIIVQLLAALPPGDIHVPLGPEAGEGIALVEGFRGDYLAWVALQPDQCVRRAHLRDPSWFQWPLLEAAIEGNIVADFPICNKSFNCSYSGHDG